MDRSSEKIDFSGKLLIAMPGMGDMRFDRAVVFLCAHSDDGAMGLIVNKPSEDLSFKELAEQLSIKTGPVEVSAPIHFGGPVDHGRGFVLHTSDYFTDETTLAVNGGFGMTATMDILKDIAVGKGPKSSLMALGYAGWGPGQLEGEIQQNGWLLCDATPKIVFDMANTAKWEAALRTLGVDPVTLSASSGHA